MFVFVSLTHCISKHLSARLVVSALSLSSPLPSIFSDVARPSCSKICSLPVSEQLHVIRFKTAKIDFPQMSRSLRVFWIQSMMVQVLQVMSVNFSSCAHHQSCAGRNYVSKESSPCHSIVGSCFRGSCCRF